MAAADWIAYALAGNAVWNIGQLDKITVRELEKLVRKGVLAKSRLSFCNISAPKSVWHLPTTCP